MRTVPIPDQPVRIVLVGTGVRSRTIYQPLFSEVKPWVEVVAVCDPVKEHADEMARELGVPAYYDIHQLVKDRPMEAALVVVPTASHHAISVYLSSNGIHNHTETTWASMMCQAKEMISVAREHAVIVRVAENFFRLPVDRFAQTLRDSGYLGRIGRILSYADHTGYHNNSRWITFAGCHPVWVQCVEHSMSHPGFYSAPMRYHDSESLKSNFFYFPNDFLVMDTGSGHVKGHLGRHPRPGYNEWHGERGTFVYRATGHAWSGGEGELRYVPDERLAAAQEARGDLNSGGIADVITPVVMDWEETVGWKRSYAETPQGLIEYVNPFPTTVKVGNGDASRWYGVAVIGHLVDFALAVRGLRESEFTEEDALMSEMMLLGARESALQEGRRIRLPLEGDLESDAITRKQLKEKLGVDPMDVEAMLAISYQRA